MKQTWTLGTLALLGATLALAQRPVEVITITPRITGGDSNSGKCIIRIMVDDTVNVRIGNGRIQVETLTGRPTRDDGSECSALLQNGRNLTAFRFRGIDGRGEVRLQSDPRQDSRGEAVVYIRDSKGGDEGYTFEVTWEGDSGGNGGGRGGGFFSGNRGTGFNNSNASNSCTDSARQEIEKEFGVTILTFDANSNNNQSRITGTARAGRRGDRYLYDCQMDQGNGSVRNVSVRRQ